ncbi:thioredoxin family protein [Entomospira culicis]|uniref:Thioredoxin family protein n=1 Tax=Entomospira culicis TaxID=2719989 RepID=A0A968KW85_9SPIO|nr:thioredoxin family protein [Entomospira culicis]NIZ18702.1 thioredoxin family protein [Entomospira culicis]NIZ68917.1 thioredoxin family protein [Entomospira culicis]WDI37510.1 thioredoxin family protein [Entomospira culicis]WDI39138.1 thioredoxin family protein [Entomospira culicis]
MICQIFENDGDADLVTAMLESYLEARGMQATITKYDKNFAPDIFARSHIEMTPALIIDEELVIAGEQLEARDIITRIFEVIEGETLESGSSCGSGGCGTGSSSGGGCGCGSGGSSGGGGCGSGSCGCH